YNTQGTFTITWTFTDAAGNSTTATQTVIVDNSAAPVAPVLPNVTAECSVTLVAPTVNDACTNAVITATTTDAITYSTQGTFTVNWTFTYPNGVVTATQTVIVDDVTAPVAPVLADVTGQCTATATAPTATDACAGNITATTTDATTYNVPGTYVITWTFDDGNGNTTTATQNVIVTSGGQTAVVPAVACNADTSPGAILDLTALLPTGTPAGGTFADTDLSGAVNGSTFEPNQIALGTYTVTYTATDGTCPAVVEIEVTVNDDCAVLPCGSLIVHNALTPNNDGDNDVMIIEGITEECYLSNHIEIFNRWGIQVYEAKNYNNDSVAFRGVSEGRSTLKKNEDLPSGTYFYILQFTEESGATSERSGYLYISR
ncbi:MAG: T9SS type B sorting domain-containing protein, partial [Cytophagaceae bacterium]